MAKPEDIPQDIWDAAERVSKETARNAMIDPLMPYYISAQPLVARAIMAGKAEEREACAVLTEEVGADYGEDEPRWFECCETVAAIIRKREEA